ncbi:MAG: hypothetical protein M3362_10145, partial [Acidobacteriota bacterium]|nr:hypothetical protein [Acidobacteriota bacterium]
HLLIALWDGKYQNSVGGTSQVIRFQLEGIPESYAPRASFIDTPESGPVYHIITPRKSNPKPEGEPFELHKLFPKGYIAEAERFNRIYARVEMFNRDLFNPAHSLLQATEKSKEYLFPESESKKLSPFLQSIREHFAVADSLAIFFQNRTRSTLNHLFILVLLIAISFDIYAHFFPERHWILALYLILMAGAYLWVNPRAKRHDYQNKYQDYRALAEGMRVQFFWWLANLQLSVADHYLRKQRSELDWICSAIRVWNIPTETESYAMDATHDTEHVRRCELLLRYWVQDQSNYFIKAAKRDHEKLERYEPYVRALLRIGVGVTVLMTLALLIPHPWRHQLTELIDEYHWLHALLLALMSLPAIGAALLHGYIEKRALSEHAKQYSRMSVIFSNAQERLSEMIKNGHHESAHRLLEELGKEALEENGDWVLLHRERPLEVPHAG